MARFHQGNEYEKNVGKEDDVKRLQKDLAECMEHIEDEFSLKKIDELTKQLRNMETTETQFNIKEAKEEFFRDYLPLAEQKETYAHQEYNAEKKSGSKSKFKVALILAAAFVFINGIVIAVAGMNVFEALFKWNDTSFQITVNDEYGQNTTNVDKNKLFDKEDISWAGMEKEFGAKIPIIRYFADDMEITRMELLSDDIADIEFVSSGKTYLYSAEKLAPQNGFSIVEKTEDDPTIYSYNGVKYYFIPNEKWITILWQYENQLYTLMFGDIDEIEAKKIVESIEY